jgi:hypothetical protein
VEFLSESLYPFRRSVKELECEDIFEFRGRHIYEARL